MKTSPDRIAFRKVGRELSGFTLLEVLVSLMIFALTAIVLGSAYLNVLTAYAVAARGNQSNEEVVFARGLMLAEPDRKVIEQGGDYESTESGLDSLKGKTSPGGSRHVRWSATIESTSINDLFKVTFVCEITEPGNSEPEKITQTFTVLRPTWSDPIERGQLLQDATTRITELQGKKPI